MGRGGALRAALVNALGGLVSDAVIAGEERDDLRAVLVPSWAAMRAAAGLGAEAAQGEVLAHPALRAALTERLTTHARAATGSASRIVAAMALEVPLSFDKGEVTDKGSVNQRAVLRERADLVAALYGDDARVIRADWKGKSK